MVGKITEILNDDLQKRTAALDSNKDTDAVAKEKARLEELENVVERVALQTNRCGMVCALSSLKQQHRERLTRAISRKEYGTPEEFERLKELEKSIKIIEETLITNK